MVLDAGSSPVQQWNASAGLVTGVATLVHGGRTMSTFDIVITDELGKRVCTARLSCLHRDAVPFGGTPIRERSAAVSPADAGRADGA